MRIPKRINKALDRVSVTGCFTVSLLFTALGVAGLIAAAAISYGSHLAVMQAVLAIGAVFLAFLAGMLRGEVLRIKKDARIRQLEQMAAHQTRFAADETVAMPPVTLNSDGELTQVLPWINGEARRG